MATLKGDGKALIAIFIGAIIAITLIAAIATQITGDTSTITVTNDTVTAPAVNATLDLEGRDLLTSQTVVNATNGSQACNGCILEDGIGSNGLKTVRLRLNDTAASFAGSSVNVSYTANPDGFVNGSGARNTLLVTIIIAALAILAFVISVLFGSGSMGDLIRRFK